MVISATDYKHKLQCGGRIIIPCQSFFDLPTDNGPSPYRLSNYNPLSFGDDTFDLWHKQFRRWWNWNWQRKRMQLLNKFGVKPHKKKVTLQPTIRMEDKATNTTKISETKIQPPIEKNEKETPPSGKLHEPIFEPVTLTNPKEALLPVLPICTQGLKKPYESKRNRNKKKERLYEGWMREVHSSDSEEEEIRGKDKNLLKNNQTKIHSNKDRMHYLQIRLRKLTSEEKLARKQKLKETKPDDLKQKTAEEYISPVSGKLYHCSLTKSTLPVHDTHVIKQLQPINASERKPITSSKFDWQTDFNLCKQEHKKVLQSICEVLDKKVDKASNIQTENSIFSPNYFENNVNEKFLFIKKISTDNLPPSLTSSVRQEVYQKPIKQLKSNIKRSDYDINYIKNNLESFSNYISEICCLEHLENSRDDKE